MSDSPTTCQCQVEDRKIPALLIDNLLRRFFRPPAKFLAKYLSAGNTAADLGCGPGFFSLPMAKIVGEKGRVHAVDFDRRAIDRLQMRAERVAEGASITPRAASAAEIDFIDSDTVDFVLAEGLLCCMKDHDGAVGQIKRILKPEGRAYLSVIKFSRSGDPRGVSTEEWNSLLEGFETLDRGESLISRWALVSPRN